MVAMIVNSFSFSSSGIGIKRFFGKSVGLYSQFYSGISSSSSSAKDTFYSCLFFPSFPGTFSVLFSYSSESSSSF
jgi:hypothetical protein